MPWELGSFLRLRRAYRCLPATPMSYAAGCANGDCTHRRVAGAVYRCREAGPAAARGATTLPRSIAPLERAGESDGGPRPGEDRGPALRRVAVCGAGPAARRP